MQIAQKSEYLKAGSGCSVQVESCHRSDWPSIRQVRPQGKCRWHNAIMVHYSTQKWIREAMASIQNGHDHGKIPINVNDAAN